jgi:hypothetical protein
LRADLRKRFPQLGAVEIEHAWTGAIGVTVHRMPQVGEMSPGVWLASGFGPHGLNTTAMAASLIAGAIVEGDDRFRLFEPFELVWAGGRMGRVVTKRFYKLHRAYEQWASRRARRNELWWIENEPRLKKEAEEAVERARIREEERAAAEVERAAREKIEAEQAELRRIERERLAAEKAEARRIRAEQKAAARAEAARLKEERRAVERAEKERIAAERAEAKRLEAERLAVERAEAERLAAQRAEADRIEAERLAAEAAEAQRADAERIAAERLAAEQVAAERLSAAVAGEPIVGRAKTGGAQEEAGPASVEDEPRAAATPEAPVPEPEPIEEPKSRRRGFWRKG